jgi:hypothetical protein
MKPYPWREVLLSCAALTAVACLLIGLFTAAAAYLIWSTYGA